MAHVLSAQETRASRDGEVLNRGVNSIQLSQHDGRCGSARCCGGARAARSRFPTRRPARPEASAPEFPQAALRASWRILQDVFILRSLIWF